MNLYRSLGHTWTGTMNDAKLAQGGKDFEAIDVPTDKAGLIAFLNEMEARLVSEDFGTIGDVDLDWVNDAPAADAERIADMGLTVGEPYQNGDPTRVFAKSRDPAAVFNCTACGHQNRNQTHDPD